MSSLLAGVLSALVASNSPAALSNLVTTSTGLSVSVPASNDPVEREFKKIMEDDQDAEDEVDRWIQENNAFEAKGAGIPRSELNERIRKRMDPVRKEYQDFIGRHPNHAASRIAFASFLDDLGEADEQAQQLEKARELDPTNPAVWNQLANYYGEYSPVKKAFEYYAKAIELSPREPVYYQNLATTVYLFRKDAREYYSINEQQVFDKALDLYLKALKLDPTNFALALDYATSYYGIRPVRTEDALRAWTNVLHIASDESEREEVYIHLARFKITAGRYDEARRDLGAVTNAVYAEQKKRVQRNLEERESGGQPTNAPPADAIRSQAIPPGARKP